MGDGAIYLRPQFYSPLRKSAQDYLSLFPPGVPLELGFFFTAGAVYLGEEPVLGGGDIPRTGPRKVLELEDLQ